MVALADILRELKIDAGHVAVETEYLASKYHDKLKRECPNLTVSPAEPLLARVRMFKTPREKAQIIYAFHATEKAFLKAFSTVRIGEPERAVAIRLAEAMLTEGADQVTSNHCNAGTNTSFPHMPPSDYRIQAGDIVKSDSGGMFKPGMITTVETRVRWAGKVGYHMEDIIEITAGEPIWHAKHFPNEELFMIEQSICP